MPQSLANIIVHLMFSTKNRLPLITPAIEPELYPYLAAILSACDSPPILIDGVADHVHLTFRLARTMTLSRVVEDVKKRSSGWIKTKGPEFARFYWQNGYGASSVGQS
ncbi:MAG TPA: transposase, partial [Promineifilum sp.]|nr:transposase [Promineifilum sp.]